MHTLHPAVTIAELNHYCALCNEYRIRIVKTDQHTYNRIITITLSNTYQGIKFTAK